MRAAWYSKNGEARDVMVVGELPTPSPAAGEVRVKLVTSGVNPSDMRFRRLRPVSGEPVVPHSDGAGIIDAWVMACPRRASVNACGSGTANGNGRWARPRSTSRSPPTMR